MQIISYICTCHSPLNLQGKKLSIITDDIQYALT